MLLEEKRYQWKSMLHYYFAAHGTMEKQTVHLGKSSLAESLIRSFNKRKAKFLYLIPHKTIAIALIDKNDYLNDFTGYYNSVRGKNSAKYFHQQAEKKGALFRQIDPLAYEQEIYEINTSMPFRQGKAIKKEYLQRGNITGGEQYTVYGAFIGDKLVAYIRTLRIGEVIFINNILGHGDYLRMGVMYFLLLEVIRKVFEQIDVRFLLYDSFWGNSQGLVLFKKRFNFKACKVSWEK